MKLIYAQLTAVLATTAVLAASAPLAFTDNRAVREAAMVTASVRTSVEKGDRLAADRQFDAAREAYATAADLVRSQGRLPHRAVRRIANAYYFEGRYDAAAETLGGLAEEAASFGDIETEAWATADAAWMASLGDSEYELDLRLERLERLMDSPDLPDDVRDEIREMFTADFTVFAPHLGSW